MKGLVAERKNIKLRMRAAAEERLSCSSARPWTKARNEWLKTAALGEHSRWADQELLRLEWINRTFITSSNVWKRPRFQTR
jgi:hypothetical protein